MDTCQFFFLDDVIDAILIHTNEEANPEYAKRNLKGNWKSSDVTLEIRSFTGLLIVVDI